MDTDKSIIRARDVMQQGIITIDGMATASEVIDKMRSNNSTALLVEKRNQDDVWGIVVVQDLVRGVLADSRSPEDVNVYEIMSKPVITVPADMDIKYVARLLGNAGVRRAPVEDKGELVGLVSLSDLVLSDFLF